MQWFGYAGKILFVDLSSGKIEEKPLERTDAELYLGGLGINNKFAYDLIEPGADALAPENPIILGAGPLIGTIVPGASRVNTPERVAVLRSYRIAKMPLPRQPAGVPRLRE